VDFQEGSFREKYNLPCRVNKRSEAFSLEVEMETKILKKKSDLATIAQLKDFEFKSGLRSTRVKSLDEFIEIGEKDFKDSEFICQIDDRSVQVYCKKEIKDGEIEELACRLAIKGDEDSIPNNSNTGIDEIVETLKSILL